MVILLCCGLSACGGSLSDALGPGDSAFSQEPADATPDATDDGTTADVADSSVPVTTSPLVDDVSTTPLAGPDAPIDLQGWQAPWPASWGPESPFFGGWLRFTGVGSAEFANNVTTEVFPPDPREDDEMLAMMEQVLVSVAADVVIIERAQTPHPSGFVELNVRYEYPVAGETIQGVRSLFRGPQSSLLVTLTASKATFGEESERLRTTLDALVFDA